MGSVGSDPGPSLGLPANEYELSASRGGHVEDRIRGQIRRIFNITFFGHEEDGPQSSHHPRGLLDSRPPAQHGRRRRLDHGASFYGASLAFPRRLGAPGGGRQAWKAIAPTNKYLLMWEQFLLLLAAYSAAITPFQFGFFLTVPRQIIIVDTVVNFFFLSAMVVQFFVAVKDRRTLTLIEDRALIAKRYFQSTFVPELLGIIPWSVLYNTTGAHGYGAAEVLRWMIWCRCFRVVHVDSFFEKLERDIRLSYFVVRIAKLLVTMVWCTHVAGCIFYYLATTVPAEESLDTWMGSLVLGSNVYVDFRHLDLGVRYVTSLYWAFITISTIGYGDVHPVNLREMLFAIVYVAFGVVLNAYLVGNITALIVKGSPTETYRDKMSALVTYMHRTNLPPGLRHQMRQHIRLQFETRSGEEAIMESFPVSIRQKVARARFRQTVEGCYLFAECSAEFVDQIVGRCTPEFFMPSEVVVAHKDAGDLMYIICYGAVDEIYMGKEGEEESVETRTRGHALGEVALLCNIPQPFVVRVKELCQLLRIEKVVLNGILGNYLVDGRQMVTNLLHRMNNEASKVSALAGEVTDLISQQEAEMVMGFINAAARGDLRALDQLMKAGANPKHADYDGRTALHLAASKGYNDVVKFLVQHKVDLNCRDHFGNTPLLEALRAGHDATAQLLASKGGEVSLQKAGSDLCDAVIRGDTGLLQRLLQFGVDPNSADYDSRVPLHIAAAEGFLLIACMLVENGADVFARDRWGNTALDEAGRSGSMPLVQLLEEAMLKKVGGEEPMRKGGVEEEEEKDGFSSDHDGVTSTTLSMAAQAVAHHVSSSGGGGEMGEEGGVRGGSVYQGLPLASPRLQTQSACDVEGGRVVTGPLARPMGSNDYRSQLSSRSQSGAGTPHQSEYRRRRSRGGVGVGLSSEAKPKRVTIYPYHPWAQERKAGRLIFMPPTLKDLLAIANGQFGEGGTPFTRVLSSDGGEVSMMDLMLEGDRVYMAGDEDPKEA